MRGNSNYAELVDTFERFDSCYAKISQRATAKAAQQQSHLIIVDEDYLVATYLAQECPQPNRWKTGTLIRQISTTSYNTYNKKKVERLRWHKVVTSLPLHTPQRHQSFGSLLSATAIGSLSSCFGVSTIALPCMAMSFDSPAALNAACCNCGLTVVISVVGWDPLR